jgi:hypothetical protein
LPAAVRARRWRPARRARWLRSTWSSTCVVAAADRDPRRSRTSLPSRRRPVPSSSGRASGSPAAASRSTSTCSRRNCGFEVRAFGPRRSQATSLVSRLRARSGLTARGGGPLGAGLEQRRVGPVVPDDLRRSRRRGPPGVGQVEHPVGDPLQHVAVVGDEQQPAGAAPQLVLEPVDRVDVEVVGRLVEDQQVGRRQQGAGERDASSLPARHARAGLSGSTPTRSSSAAASCAGRAGRRRAPPRARRPRPSPGPGRASRPASRAGDDLAGVGGAVARDDRAAASSCPEPFGPTTPTRSSEVSPKEASAKRVRPSTDAVTRSTETRCTRAG